MGFRIAPDKFFFVNTTLLVATPSRNHEQQFLVNEVVVRVETFDERPYISVDVIPDFFVNGTVHGQVIVP